MPGLSGSIVSSSVQINLGNPGVSVVFQLGGYNDNNELSRCEVAELLFYDRKLSEIELIAVQSLLDGKYGLDFGEVTTATALDVNTPGIYTLEYITADKAGNTSTASRKVVVEEGSTLPVITLKGDTELTLDGSTFEDPELLFDAGGNTLDAPDVNTSGQVDTSRPGIYKLTYDFISAERQRAISVQRKITVVDTVTVHQFGWRRRSEFLLEVSLSIPEHLPSILQMVLSRY